MLSCSRFAISFPSIRFPFMPLTLPAPPGCEVRLSAFFSSSSSSPFLSLTRNPGPRPGAPRWKAPGLIGALLREPSVWVVVPGKKGRGGGGGIITFQKGEGKKGDFEQEGGGVLQKDEPHFFVFCCFFLYFVL